jgi:hypothetical protein
MSGRERNMLILMVVLAAGAAVYFFLFVLGGEDPAEQAAPTPAASPPAVPSEEGAGVLEPPEAPRAVSFMGGRDPFVPLVVEPVATTTAAGTTETSGATEASGTTESGQTTGETTGETTEPSATGAQEEGQVSFTGRPVVLVDVYTDDGQDVAEVEVEGDPYTVAEGQRFLRNYQLVSVSGGCARFLYGDESFTLCKGAAPR